MMMLGKSGCDPVRNTSFFMTNTHQDHQGALHVVTVELILPNGATLNQIIQEVNIYVM